MLRRVLSASLTLLALHFCLLGNLVPALGQSADVAVLSSAEVLNTTAEPPAAPAQVSEPVFKSGVKYDPTTHQWLDRYNGKAVALGLPGVIGRYGCNNVIASNDLLADGSTPGPTTPGSTFPYKKFLFFTLLGLGIGTSIALPIALGVHHHHHHHLNTTQQQNQLALYSFFHNKTISVPTFIPPPPPPPPHHEGGGGGGGGGQLRGLFGF